MPTYHTKFTKNGVYTYYVEIEQYLYHSTSSEVTISVAKCPELHKKPSSKAKSEAISAW